MKALNLYLPKQSVRIIISWLEKYQCKLTITKARSSKLGDYRYFKGKHFISINNNLNPYSFLITLTHEIAHMVVKEEFSAHVMPHGKEWKNTFQQLMLRLLPLFPENIQKHLALHLKNPKASTSADYNLVLALREYDSAPTLTISDIPYGSTFSTPNGKRYIKEKKIKKRYQCKSLQNDRIYLFSPIAEVII